MQIDIFKTSILKTINKGNFLPTDNESGGLTYEFAGHDSVELYTENLKTQPADWYYRTNAVKYKLNKHGYRTYEFKDIDWANSVVIFGCSNVYGVGLDEPDTLASQLSSIINHPVINMGVGGSSIMYSFHNSVILRNNYPVPKAVVHIWSDFSRAIYYSRKSAMHCGSWNLEPNSYTDLWNKDKHHGMIHATLSNMASKILWKDTKYYESSYFEQTAKLFDCDSIKYIDHARDLCHPGIKTNNELASRIAKQLQI